MSAVLELDRVERTYGGLRAVHDVTMRVEAGARLAILGPNGAGKTTLFHLISGEVPLTTGRIYLFGRDVTRWRAHRRAMLGLRRTYQITNLFPRLTVLEHILLAIQALSPAKYVSWMPLRRYRALYDQAEKILDDFGLYERRFAPAASLSYGEQRELEIAVAMAGEPRLLLLDEPLAGLSRAESHRIMSIVGSIPASVTILLIEHDMDAAFRFARDMVVLHHGEVVAQGRPHDIQRHPRVQEIYLGVDRDASA